MSIAETVELVARRSRHPSTRTDQSEVSPTTICPAVSSHELAAAAARLGVALPEILQRVYREIGNGGFGPGYGLLGLAGGFTDDLGHTSEQLHVSFREANPDDPAWAWPQSLLPICHWGCAIYSCVDLSRPEADIIIWDPNEYETGTDPRTVLRPHGRGLESWLKAWAEGTDLWAEMFPDPTRA